MQTETRRIDKGHRIRFIPMKAGISWKHSALTMALLNYLIWEKNPLSASALVLEIQKKEKLVEK